MALAATYEESDLRKLIDAASQVGTAGEGDFIANLRNEDEAVRYWAAVGLSAAKDLSPKATGALRRALKDPDVTVRIEAAGALARHAETDVAIPALSRSLESKNLAAVLHTARTIQLLGDTAKDATAAMRSTETRLAGLRPKDLPATVVLPGDLDMAMFIGFATSAFLEQTGTPSAQQDGQGDDEADWLALFDGKSLAGWKVDPDSNKAQISVVDGEIHMLSRGKNLWMPCERVFRDFELEVEALMPTTYNSGIGFRCATKGKFTGYQCEIDRAKSGSIYAIGRGWVWPRGAEQTTEFNKLAADAFRNGEWNRFRIRCVGDHIQIWINGVNTADIRDRLFAEGVVALQHHGKGDVHRFRNIRIRSLKSDG
jgi:hypothetical protein